MVVPVGAAQVERAGIAHSPLRRRSEPCTRRILPDATSSTDPPLLQVHYISITRAPPEWLIAARMRREGGKRRRRSSPRGVRLERVNRVTVAVFALVKPCHPTTSAHHAFLSIFHWLRAPRFCLTGPKPIIFLTSCVQSVVTRCCSSMAAMESGRRALLGLANAR